MYACMWVGIYVCTYIFRYIRVHAMLALTNHTRICTSVHICVSIYVCVSIFLYTMRESTYCATAHAFLAAHVSRGMTQLP